MTLDEIARKLGVSKSTVSRALSGKGRIGEETRRKIMSYAASQGYSSKRVSEREKEEATRNLGVVLPPYTSGKTFFQNCLQGICETASQMEYNVLVAIASSDDISAIQNLVEEKKVDGIILTSSHAGDRAVQYLLEKHFPTGMTGSCDAEEILQVDTDNKGVAETLTSVLIGKGYRKFALVVEDLAYQVNRSRYDGFMDALFKNGISEKNQLIYTRSLGLRADLLDVMISDILTEKVECVICGDDEVCTRIMSRLQAEGYRIPRDIAVASLYNSPNLSCFSPAVTAVNVSAWETGIAIGKQMINYLEGRPYEKKSVMDYGILLRKSTNRIWARPAEESI